MNQKLAEAVDQIYDVSPLLCVDVAWDAYRRDLFSLGDAASFVGLGQREFILLRRLLDAEQTEVPYELAIKANPQEYISLSYLGEERMDLLLKMLDKDLLFPSNKAFVTSLWEDLRILEALGLVRAFRGKKQWRYQLNIGK